MKYLADVSDLICVCTGKKCKSKGSKELYKTIKETAKSKKEGTVQVIKTKCLDHCKKGPIVIDNHRMWSHVTDKNISKIFS